MKNKEKLLREFVDYLNNRMYFHYDVADNDDVNDFLKQRKEKKQNSRQREVEAINKQLIKDLLSSIDLLDLALEKAQPIFKGHSFNEHDVYKVEIEIENAQGIIKEVIEDLKK